MGRKINALFGRSLKPAKFKPLVNLATKRFSVLKAQRRVRFDQARSDVLQLLNLGHHERALLRVEQVIKEQNMLDVFTMMDGYCSLLIERIHLIEQEKECPEELKEAISSLLYAASRCGDLPEVQEIRAVLTSRYGREFAARAIELRNNCGVNLTLVQKLSTRMPTLETRMSTLEEIASENGIVLQFEKTPSATPEGSHINQEHKNPEPNPTASSNDASERDHFQVLPEMIEKEDDFVKPTKYRDVAHAAQAAFESAAYAAAAARAAVELSRSESHDPDDHSSPHSQKREHYDERMNSNQPDAKSEISSPVGLESEKVHPSEEYDSETDDEEILETVQTEDTKQIKNGADLKESSSSSSDTSDTPIQLKPQEIAFDKSDDEKVRKPASSSMMPRLLISEVRKTEEHISSTNDPFDENEEKLHYLSQKQHYTRYRDRLNVPMRYGNSTGNSSDGAGVQRAQVLNIEKKPFSMRTRGVHVR